MAGCRHAAVPPLAIALLAIPFCPPIRSQVSVSGTSDEETQRLREQCRSIQLDDGSDFADLEFLRELLEDKRVVLLGEPNHGSREIFLLKNRLIRFLHRELGYRVLLLESGIGEVYSLNYRRDELSEPSMLAAGLIGPWRSREFIDLMTYVKRTPSLYVGGYDVQRSGRSLGEILQSVSDVLGRSEFHTDIEDRFSDALPVLTNRQREFDAQTAEEVAELCADYATLSELISTNRSALTGETWSSEQVTILTETFRNRIAYLDYFSRFRRDNDFRRRWEARDRALAKNVSLFANQLFPDEKVIISGHNFHVARHNATENVMGELLAETFGDSMYSIGFFAGSGTFANNSRNPEQLGEPTVDNDIQRIIDRIDMPVAFLDVPDRPTAGTGWLFKDTVANHTFLDLDGRNTLTLGESFDGLMMIAEISMARY